MQKTSSKSSAAMKLGLAAVASIALTFGAAMPAFAADTQIGPDNVKPFEIGDEALSTWNYDQWHIGSERDGTRDTLEGSLAFGECEVTLGTPSSDGAGWVQVMKGYSVADRPSGVTGGDVSEIKALIDSTSINVLKGDVTVQIPIFVRMGDASPAFTTILTASLGTGVHNLAGADLRISADLDTSFKLDAFLAGIAGEFGPNAVIEILGVGFNGNPDSSVKSLTFDGNSYFFGTGGCLPAGVTPPTKIETAA